MATKKNCTVQGHDNRTVRAKMARPDMDSYPSIWVIGSAGLAAKKARKLAYWILAACDEMDGEAEDCNAHSLHSPWDAV